MSLLNTGSIWIWVSFYILLAMVLVAVVPGLIAPKKGLSPADKVDILDLQNKIRQTVIQVAGGFAFLFSVFMALNAQDSSNRDLKAKYDRETAELFVKAVESASPEALYSLAYVAQRDGASYHDTIYRMLASVIRNLSATACKADGNDAERAKARTRLQVAFELMHERNVDGDPAGASYNVEHSCLDGVDLGIQLSQWGKFKGLRNVRLSGAHMLRIDFTRAELQGAELMGITAGDWHNPGWDDEPHKYELQDQDSHGAPVWKAIRRQFLAHFIDTNLTGARLDGAGLEGADFAGAKLAGAVFDGANVSRANFRGAQGLTAAQLGTACVGRKSDPVSLRRDQPFLSEPLKGQVEALGGIGGC